MAVPRILFTLMMALATALASTGTMAAQENASAISQNAPMPHLSPGAARKPLMATTPDQVVPPQVVPLTVPKQTSLQVALDKELRVRKVGQSVSARLVDPVYAFDRLVVPGGSRSCGPGN